MRVFNLLDINQLCNDTHQFKVEHALGKEAKDCELVVNKIVCTKTSTTMVASARDVTNRTKMFMLELKEKSILLLEKLLIPLKI